MGISPQKIFTFDVKLFATIEVAASSENEARTLHNSKLGAASCNGGCWENGQPILFEASVDDGESACELVTVDGQSV